MHLKNVEDFSVGCIKGIRNGIIADSRKEQMIYC